MMLINEVRRFFDGTEVATVDIEQNPTNPINPNHFGCVLKIAHSILHEWVLGRQIKQNNFE